MASIRSVYGSAVACKVLPDVLLDVDENEKGGFTNPCTSLLNDTKMTAVEDSFMADKRSLAALVIVDEIKGGRWVDSS